MRANPRSNRYRSPRIHLTTRAARSPTNSTHGFAARCWQPFEFQREVWRDIAAGTSGMSHASTGAGKSWAVWFGTLAAFASAASTPRKCPEPLTVL